MTLYDILGLNSNDIRSRFWFLVSLQWSAFTHACKHMCTNKHTRYIHARAYVHVNIHILGVSNHMCIYSSPHLVSRDMVKTEWKLSYQSGYNGCSPEAVDNTHAILSVQTEQMTGSSQYLDSLNVIMFVSALSIALGTRRIIPGVSTTVICCSLAPKIKTIWSSSIRYRSDGKVSDRCLIEVDPRVFVVRKGHV